MTISPPPPTPDKKEMKIHLCVINEISLGMNIKKQKVYTFISENYTKKSQRIQTINK